MAKKTKAKVTPKTLKPIHASKAIIRGIQKDLLDFTKQINKSFHYYTLAQFHKYERGEVTNLAQALSVTFNTLNKRFNTKAGEFSIAIAGKAKKQIRNYVDLNYSRQGENLKLDTLSRRSAEILKSAYLNQIALIKSIPNDILKRYENAFYNSVGSFDESSISKLALNIGQVSKDRAKLIARDQVSKATENFANARAKDLGFNYYLWQTAGDERVSKGKGGHDKLNNRIYSYDEPTAIIDSYGNKGHCAQRVNCRCVALPVFLENNQTLKLVKDSIAGDYYQIVQK